jgi:hypothetical protein
MIARQMGDVAKGFGPPWFRWLLVGMAVVYFAALVHHPILSFARPVQFFAESTCLFPRADVYAIEYRLAGWSCDEAKWKPIDPGAYFPIETSNKESRFQRLAYFYKSSRLVMQALDAFVVERHPGVDDGMPGTIGGIRMFETLKALPEPGGDVERYHWEPLAPIPTGGEVNGKVPPGPPVHRDAFYTPGALRKERCRSRP